MSSITQFLARIFQKTGETIGVHEGTAFSEEFNNLCTRVDEHNEWQVGEQNSFSEQFH